MNGREWRKKRIIGLCLLLLTGVCLTDRQASATDRQAFVAEMPEELTNRTKTVFNDASGMSSSEANAVLQTADGYLWIGSYGGLLRYDGKKFRNFSGEKNRIQGMGIRALFEDRDGRLWIGTNENGVFLYEKARDNFVPCWPSKEEAAFSVRSFAQDLEGRIYVAASTGLKVMDVDGSMSGVDVKELKNQVIYTLSVDENGALWGTAGSGSLFVLKDQKLVYYKEPGSLCPYSYYSVLAGGDGKVYVGTSGNELLKLTLKDKKYTEASFTVRSYDTKQTRGINSLYQTREGELWLCADTGTAYFDGRMRYVSPDFLEESAFISGMTQDYEGSLWLASTKYGVFRLAEGKFYSMGKKGGPEGKTVNAVLRLDSLCYYGTDEGLYVLDKRYQPVSNQATRELEGIRVRHLMNAGEGKIWISTYSEKGLVCYDTNSQKLIFLTEKDGLLSNRVRSTLKLSDGRVAVATGEGVQIIEDGRIKESYGVRQGLLNPVILCLCEKEDGTLLAGSDGMGVYAIKDGKVKNYGREEGLTAGSVLRMTADPKEKGLWISAGSGLFFWDRDGIREIEGLNKGIGSIFDIVLQGDTIWLLKSDGILSAQKKDLSDSAAVLVRYGKESGLRGNITANSWNFVDGHILYLCTVNGPAFFGTGDNLSGVVPPKTAVSEIVVEDNASVETVYANPEEITIPDTTRRVTIKFAAPAYCSSSVTMEYYLEGFDERQKTVPSGEAGEVSYTNLKGGSYTFHLNARTAEGIEGVRETKVIIKKELSFWEHRDVFWAFVLFALLLAAAGVEIYMDLKIKKEKALQQVYRNITDQAMRTIANTIDAKDRYTNGHSLRVASYSRELARRLKMSEEEQEKIYYIALLHDIGKIGIPDRILNKPEGLTEEEFEIIKRHPSIGGEILKDFTALPGIGEGAKYHHERVDGSGYNEGLKGPDIPYYARIIGVADAYDAMNVSRIYRKGLTKESILQELKDQSGKQFDEDIVRAAVCMIEEGFVPAGQEMLAET